MHPNDHFCTVLTGFDSFFFFVTMEVSGGFGRHWLQVCCRNVPKNGAFSKVSARIVEQMCRKTRNYWGWREVNLRILRFEDLKFDIEIDIDIAIAIDIDIAIAILIGVCSYLETRRNIRNGAT